MLIFKRRIENQIREVLFKNGMVIILGPRQSGKTTLSKAIIDSFGDEGAYFNCEFAEVRKHFALGEPDLLLQLVGTKKIVVFDEAQTIENIGKILKVFHDTYPKIQIVATGSSSFDLANKIKEPLTGRAYEFILPPLSISEIKNTKELDESEIRNLLLYGSYPAVVARNTANEKKDELKKIATNYLYKDIYIFESIRNPKVFEDLLILLAHAVGGTVSAGKLGKDLGVAPATVEKYIRLLEQSFVIKRIYSFSRNHANELKKSYKIYFYDNGVLNALLGGFELTNNNKGHLFENLFFVEKMKAGFSEAFPPRIGFWRTKQGLEVDFIQESGDVINAYECKYGDEPVVFSNFKKFYPHALTHIVNMSNFISYF